MGGLPLRAAHVHMLLTPSAEGGKPKPFLDDPIHVIEHENFGQHQLTFRANLEVPNRLVAESQHLRARQLILVLFDALQDELLIFLAQRLSTAAWSIGLEIAQHGTVNLAIAGEQVNPQVEGQVDGF